MRYNHGSNAYQYNEDVWEQQLEDERIERRRAINARTKNRQNTFKNACLYLILGIAAAFMISKFVAVDDTQKKIDDLNKELAAHRTYTSEKTFALEQKANLTKIEDTAMTKLGMCRPEKTQVVYVDIKKNDCTEITSKEVEGTKNKLENTFKNAKQTIINIFTLR